ncbi:MAG TPA: DUF5808 domain-containing protein [Ktedonobacterales bacterium]|nr:DUF5808 domain-containing protein [Ktedonobacterales bacterium]
MGKFRWFVIGIVAGLTAAAIGEELKRAPEQREWKGTIAGVPYNFRPGEWSTIAHEYWDPASDRVMTPHAIGLGWGVNLAAVLGRLRALADVRATAPADESAPERQYR